MASTVTLEGIKKAVFFPFQGRNWGMKLLIGIVLGFAGALIVPALLVNGYAAQVMKRVILHDEDPVLPEWSDWGALLLDGLKLAGAFIVYQLPALILILGGAFLTIATNLALPIWMASLSSSNTSDLNAVLVPFFGSMAGMFLGMILTMIGFLLVFVLMIFIPPAVGNMIAKGEFTAAFRVKEWWPVFKANLSGYLLAIIIALGLFGIYYLVFLGMYMTVVLCFLLPVVGGVAGFLVEIVMYSLFAVAYRDGVKKQQLAVSV